MAVRVIRENNRSEGRAPATGVTIIAGEALVLTTGGTVTNVVGAAEHVYGIAAESTAPLPIAPASGLVAGQGFDYTNFARGGLVSCYVNGSELELYDDGHGSPIAAVTFVLNGPVYATAGGKITSAITGIGPIGSVVDFDQAASPTRLRVKFSI